MFYPGNSLKSTNFSILCMTIVWGATCSLIQEAKGLISFCVSFKCVETCFPIHFIKNKLVKFLHSLILL